MIFSSGAVSKGDLSVFSVVAEASSAQSKSADISKTNVSVLTVSVDGITINWNENKNATGYIIYRKIGDRAYEKLCTINGGSTTSYIDKTAVSDGTKYTYKIVAVNKKTEAKAGTEKAATYKYLPGVSENNYKLDARNTSNTKIDLTWVKLKASGYEILYSTNSKFTNAKKVTITSSTKTKATLSSLSKNKTYYVRIRAYKTKNGQKEYYPWSTISRVDLSGSPIKFAEQMKAPSTDKWNKSDKIYIYSFNDELESKLSYVLEKYPQYKSYVEYVNLGLSSTSGEYQAKLDSLLAVSNKNKYPSIIAMDDTNMGYYTNSNYTVTLSSVGITDSMLANAYQYTKDMGSYKNKLKALTWIATPGVVVYRYSIAKKVLGSGDPSTVQKALSSWDSFIKTAGKMKKAGYAITSGSDEISYAFLDSKPAPWVSSGKLTLASNINKYLKYSKLLFDNGYTDNGNRWTAEWTDGMMYDSNVFCYFGTTWWLYFCLNCGEEGEDNSSYGDWRVCEGPSDYHWGGTYLSITKNCNNKKLAAFILWALCCDEDVLYNTATYSYDFVNNRAVINKLISAKENIPGSLGGQNPLPVFDKVAQKINGKNHTAYDYNIMIVTTDIAYAYNYGYYNSISEAINEIKRIAADDLNLK